MDFFSSRNDDAVEVLSRLPADALISFESVSQVWRKIITDKYFRRLQCQRDKAIMSGFFVQDTHDLSFRVTYVSTNTGEVNVQPPILDFLPEVVELIASSNGLLCCRGVHSIERNGELIYVCNPAKKEYVQIGAPKGSQYEQSFALAFNPSCYRKDTFANFKLVSVNKEEDSGFLFQVYSAKSKEWKMLDVHYCDDDCDGYPDDQVVFTSGVLYWMIWNLVIAFKVETEESQFIATPKSRLTQNTPFGRCRIGESKGCLHYILISGDVLRVWKLEGETTFLLKHLISLSVMENDFPQFPYNEGKKTASLVPEMLFMSPWIEPLAFKDDIVLVKLLCSFNYTNGDPKTCTNLYLYNTATRSLDKLCTAEQLQCHLGFMIAVPYSMSLAPLV